MDCRASGLAGDKGLERRAAGFVVCAYLWGMCSAFFRGLAIHSIHSAGVGTDLHGLCGLLEEACVAIIGSLASETAEA